jgi:hypothetical protein
MTKEAVMVSRKLRDAVRTSDLKGYQIAHEADMTPSTLSRIINGIDLVKADDPRVFRIARIVGLRPEECFDRE